MGDRQRAALLVAVCAMAIWGLSVGGAAQEAVRGQPDIEVVAPDNRVAPGEEATVDLFLVNAGDVWEGGPAEFEERVTTARGTTVRVSAGDAPLSVETDRLSAGTVPVGEVGPLPVRVVVEEGAEPGTYRLPVTLRYIYTSVVSYFDIEDPQYVDRTVTVRRELRVVVEERARFAVASVESDLQVGERGEVSVVLENVGAERAREATVGLESADADLAFPGGASRVGQVVGGWEPGERRAVTQAVRVADNATARAYALSVQVNYSDPGDVPRQSDVLAVRVRPIREQSFAARDLESGLRIGREGTVRGRIVNAGPLPVRDAVVTVRAPGPTLTPVEGEFPVGDLAPNASAAFRVELAASNRTAVGPHRLALVVEYETRAGERRRSDPIETVVEVAPAQDVFAVESAAATFGVDTDDVLAVRVRNVGEEPVTDVGATLRTDEPFSSDDPTAYVSRLDPGETARLEFALSVSEDAIPKTGTVSVVLRYETESGVAKRSDEHVVPVTVVGRGREVPLLELGAAAVVLGMAAFWWWRRR